MSDLLQAAKAILEDWDRYQNVHYASIESLRDAVERDSEQGAGWDHSRAQRVWREAAEAVRKYEASLEKNQ